MASTYEPNEVFDPADAPHEGAPPPGYDSWNAFYTSMNWEAWGQFYDWAFVYYQIKDDAESSDASVTAG